jgi:hypothetical protein
MNENDLWLILAAVVFTALVAGWWTGRLLPGWHRRRALAFILFNLLWTSALVVVVHVLAFVELFSGRPVVTAGWIFLGATGLYILSRFMGRFLKLRRPHGDTALRAVAESTAHEPRSPLGAGLIISLILVIGVYFLFALDAATSFPDTWDGVAYHLPTAVKWIQSASLRMPADGAFFFSLPGNGEIMMMLGLMTGRLSLGEMCFVPAGLAMIGAVYQIARGIGCSRRPAMWAALVVAVVPMIIFQMFSSYIDMFGAAFIMTSAALVLHYQKNPDGPAIRPGAALPLAGLALGVAVGTKPTLWPFALAGFAWITVAAWRKMSGGAVKKFTGAAARCLLAGMFVLIASGFWFVRGAVQMGNPLYPAQLKIGSMEIGKSRNLQAITPADYENHYVHSPWQWPAYPWTEWSDAGSLYHYSTGRGVGAAFAVLVPAVLAGLWRGLFSKSPHGRFGLKRQSAVFALLFAAIWLVLPHLPRFGLASLGLACAMGAMGLEGLSIRARKWYAVWLTLGVAVGAVLLSYFPARMMLNRHQLGAWSHSAFYHHLNNQSLLIDRLPADTRVLFVERNNNPALFGLFGPALTNHVEQFRGGLADVSVEMLREKNIDYIVLQVKDAQPPVVNLPLEPFAQQAPLPGGDETPWRVYRVLKKIPGTNVYEN